MNGWRNAIGVSRLELIFSHWKWENLIDSYEPSLRGVAFSEVFEVEVFQTDLAVSNGIVTRGLIVLGSNFSESIVAKSIHKTVFHGLRDLGVDSVGSASIIVVFFDLREDTSANSYHPKELGDIVTRVITEATEDDQNVISIK